MGYDLRDFNTTFYGKASQNSQTILNKWPYLCSRQALVVALENVATGSVTQRNPNGYTAEQMADKIIQRFDEIMYDTWSNSTVYDPFAFAGAISAGYRWDQPQFWGTASVHFIFHNGAGGAFANIIVSNIDDIILWPQQQYEVNTAEFKQKPYLGFDKTMLLSEFGAELDMSLGQVTGITSGGTQVNHDGATSEIPANDIHKSLMYVYDNSYYHPTFQPNGFNSSQYLGDNPPDWQTFPSSKRYDQSIAKFEVTVSGGEVTAITAVSRLDGDGNPLTGGWDYTTSDDYRQLLFQDGLNVSSSTKIEPRILYRANADQPGYTGNKAQVNISDPTAEFYAGKGHTDGTYDAYAVYGSGSYGFEVDPSGTDAFDDWFDVNLPTNILPSSVRLIVERPVLKSTTRSLKTIKVGTGAHRIGFEFEYPPMTYSEAQPFLKFFELTKGGAQECQIYVPNTAMSHTESVFYNAPVYKASSRLRVTDAPLGSSTITVSGLEPGVSHVPEGTYFLFIGSTKIYQVVDTGTPDAYGRQQWRVEPPLLSNQTGQYIRGRTTNNLRSDFFLVKAFVVDDTLDYTVDAAGHYRLRFKFVEAL